MSKMASVLKDSPEPPHPSGHRNIVLALDKTEDSEKVLRWARQYHKPGDVLHVAHVAKVIGHKDEIFHGTATTQKPNEVCEAAGVISSDAQRVALYLQVLWELQLTFMRKVSMR